MNELKGDLPEDFKMTELGPLPEEWEVIPLENKYIEFKNGLWKGKREPYIKVRVLRNTNFNSDGTICFDDIAELDVEQRQFKDREILKYDIILERSGGGPTQPVGRVVFFERNGQFKYSFSNFTTRIRVIDRKKIFPKYLFYFLLDFYLSGKTNDIQNRTTGIRNLDFSKYKQILIPLPPLSEQKKIAAILSVVQEAKEKTEAVISTARDLKKSMMKYLFTYGPAPIWKAESVLLQETEIGVVPKFWEISKLGNVFDVQQGKQLSAKEKKEGKIRKPFLRTSNLPWGHIDIANVDEMYFTPKEFDKLKLNEGDILVCEGGDVGRTALYRGELGDCAYQNHIHRLRPKKSNIHVEFFVFWMEYAITQLRLYIYTANRTTIPNLSSSRLKDFVIPLPPLAEQQNIASILSAIDEKIEAEEGKKRALEDLFRSMLHNLMTAKIRVNNLAIDVGEEL